MIRFGVGSVKIGLGLVKIRILSFLSWNALFSLYR